jgi:hypothetical protein
MRDARNYAALSSKTTDARRHDVSPGPDNLCSAVREDRMLYRFAPAPAELDADRRVADCPMVLPPQQRPLDPCAIACIE